jgi:hypothetical protein
VSAAAASTKEENVESDEDGGFAGVPFVLCRKGVPFLDPPVDFWRGRGVAPSMLRRFVERASLGDSCSLR